MTTKQDNCKKKLFDAGVTEIGALSTYYNTDSGFFAVFMTFGCSYSLIYVDCIDWVKTKLWKRLLRGIIGVGLACLMFFGLS